jgi:hypothetical protein
MGALLVRVGKPLCLGALQSLYAPHLVHVTGALSQQAPQPVQLVMQLLRGERSKHREVQLFEIPKLVQQNVKQNINK